MSVLKMAALVGLAGLAAGPVAAQISLGAGGVYATFKGTDFNETDPGFGFDAQIRFPIGPSASLGLGGQRTSHGLSGVVHNLTVLGIFAEPRVTFATGGSARPYLMARGGYLHDSYAEPGFDTKANGYFVGGGAGLLVRAGPSFDIDLAVFFDSASLGDYTANGTPQPDTGTKGGLLVLRGGILFGLGK
jgi:hypothetical protein